VLLHIAIELFAYINFVCDEKTQVKLFGVFDMQKPADVLNQLLKGYHMVCMSFGMFCRKFHSGSYSQTNKT